MKSFKVTYRSMEKNPITGKDDELKTIEVQAHAALMANAIAKEKVGEDFHYGVSVSEVK